jgi:LuxR family maltose regulon positive regulatory protein
MDRDARALAALGPEGPLPDVIAEGWAALNRGEWQRARDRFEAALAGEETPEALEGLAWAAWWLDDTAALFDARERAYALYRRRGDRRGAARAATWLGLDYIDFRGESAVASGWLGRARRLLDALPRSREHAWLSVFDAHHALMADKNPVAAQRLAAGAAETSEALGITDVEMMGRALEGLALVSQGKIRDGMRLLDEATAAAAAGEIGNLQATALTCCYLINACERVRDYPRAAQWCDRVKELCRRWRCTMLFAVCRTQYAGVLIWRGQWAEAEGELDAAARELTAVRPALAHSATARLAELRRRQGRWEEAVRLFRQVEASTGALLGRAELALEQGDAAAAADLAERYLRRFSPESHTERVPGLDVLARAVAALGDLERAGEALRQLESTAAAVATEPLQAMVCFARGVVAAQAGEHERARVSFEDAVDLFARCDAPFELARARLELARSLLAQGRRDAAAREIDAAADAFRALGAARDVERASALRGDARAEPAASPRPSSASPLTSREIDVLRLVAQGLSDREVAVRLSLSEHTVHRHVSNILTKLGLASRTAAATYAARRGLL